MPLSILTVRGIGRAVLRSPLPRSTYRQILGQGTSLAAVRSMPDELIDILLLACRRKGNPKTVASLMRAIDGFRRPRPETMMSDSELARIQIPAFYWGREDPFLTPHKARPSIAKIPGAVLHEVTGGHAPWFENPSRLRQIDRRPPEGADVSGEKGRPHGTTAYLNRRALRSLPAGKGLDGCRKRHRPRYRLPWIDTWLSLGSHFERSSGGEVPLSAARLCERGCGKLVSCQRCRLRPRRFVPAVHIACSPVGWCFPGSSKGYGPPARSWR